MTAVMIYDSFLPKADHDMLEQIMLGDSFPWYFSKTKVKTGEDTPHNYQFTHMIYDNYVPMSEMWGQLDPIIRRINAQAWLRTKANLSPRTETPYVYGMHQDIDDFVGKTAVYYVNDNNGATVFASGERLESKANRLVVFNADLFHSGVSCTDEKVRCVINLNFLPNRAFNLSKEDWKRIKVSAL